ncbi:MFS transporter [Arcanobacterium haemolyticum]|nr:MFS transporter [Arcanobacterium haemolyticum]
MSHPTQTKDTVVERTMGDLVKAAVSGWLGTALEFMDFQLYSLAAALVFGKIFFAGESPQLAVISAMATYGVGYIARPIGAWYFGRLGDRVGRTKVLYYTIIIMGLSTTLIGALPTYQTIGLGAPALLVLLRLLQGFGAGAEISGAGVMLAEYAPAKKRGIVASLVALGTNCGTLGASAIWGILVAVLDEEQLLAWGWRIPFLASAIIMAFAVWIRIHLKETPVFEERDDVVDGKALSDEEVMRKAIAENDTRMIEALKQKPYKAVAVAFALRFGQAGNSGLIQTFLISYIAQYLLMDKVVATNAVMISSLVAFAIVPLCGWLGDMFGRTRMYQVFGALSLIVAIPALILISQKVVALTLIGYVLIHNVCVMSMASLENLTLPEIFGARNRYSLTAVTREIAAMIATGLLPVIASALVAAWTGSWVPIAAMIIFDGVVVLIAATYMPEVAGRDLTDPRSAL